MLNRPLPETRDPSENMLLWAERYMAARRASVEAAIPKGKSYAEALIRAQAKLRTLPDMSDESIEELNAHCIGLCRGNETAGKILASDCISS